MTRDEFLNLAPSIPKRAINREVLGYAWEILVENATPYDASCYVWPETCNQNLSSKKIRGNFLALPNYPWAFMYPGWDYETRNNFVVDYSSKGFNILPISLWATYAGQKYNFINDIQAFRDRLIELKQFGIEPILFVITDAVDSQTEITPAKAEDFCNYFLPKVADLLKFSSLGWELNQVKGWNEREGNKNSGHDMIKLSNIIRQHLPMADIGLHLQPNWWAPHYEGHDEVAWWKDALNVNTLYFQIAPDSSLSLTLPGEPEDKYPESEQGLYLALKYKGARPDAPGIAGRMQALHRNFIMFEHSRELDRWNQVIEIVNQDDRVKGYC